MTSIANSFSYITCPICVQRGHEARPNIPKSFASFEDFGQAYIESTKHIGDHIRAELHRQYAWPLHLTPGVLENILQRMGRSPLEFALTHRILGDALITAIRHDVISASPMKARLARLVGAERLDGVLPEAEYQGIQDRLNGIAGIILAKLCRLPRCRRHKPAIASHRR